MGRFPSRGAADEPILTNAVTEGDERCHELFKSNWRCQRPAGHNGIHQTIDRNVEWYDIEQRLERGAR